MLGKVTSCAVIGLDGAIVEVEVDILPGLPAFNIVGLPDTAVQESRERVRSAIKNSGCIFPNKRITVNLAPADLRKEGPSYDLPIALGILLSSEQVVCNMPPSIFLGELSLDGTLRHTQGVLPMVALAKERGYNSFFLPAMDAREAGLVDGVKVYPLENLYQLLEHLSGHSPISAFKAEKKYEFRPSNPAIDMCYIKGQEHIKRALEVASAGGHNVLMSGPPGSGKTLLARAIPSILPVLTFEEALEITRIYSVCGLLPPDKPLVTERPFRSPHYTVSHAGLVGGGSWPKPGEISLSHRGVLFLDEFPEFGHAVLEVLRQPLEDKVVTISRAQGSMTFPANFMLIGAMNPCPCGYCGDTIKPCVCAPAQITRYQKRISGPLLDRIDIFVGVPRIEYEKLTEERNGENSEAIQKRVEGARAIQRGRFQVRRILANSEMTPVEVKEFCQVEPAAQNLLRAAMKQLHLSARAFHRVLKLSRTIADLAGASAIEANHIAEAIQYRPRGFV